MRTVAPPADSKKRCAFERALAAARQRARDAYREVDRRAAALQVRIAEQALAQGGGQ